MWILSWTRYKISKLATFVSAVGAIFRYLGVVCLISELIPAGIVCIIIGIALHFGGKAIAKSKAKKAAQFTTPRTFTAKPMETPQQNPTPQASAPVQQPQFVPETTKLDNTNTAGLRRPCPQCGSFVQPNAKFCNDCGAKVALVKYCPQCGNTLCENDKFCSQCGYQNN